jgi:ferredoxin
MLNQPAAARPHRLRIEPAGWDVPVAPGQSLLEAALVAGIQMPRSCRNGTCRACLCHMLSGQVGYRVAWPGLSADEKLEGHVLPCVALPLSDVVLNVPLARRNDGDPSGAAR